MQELRSVPLMLDEGALSGTYCLRIRRWPWSCLGKRQEDKYMIVRFSCVLALVLWVAGCNRQHNQQPAAGVAGGQVTATTTATTTATPPVPAAGANPEPVERSVPPVEAFLPPESAASQPAVILPAGTRIRVRLGQGLDSKHSRPGERFVAYLDNPVIVGGRLIVPKGTAFEGHVMEAKSSGRLKGRAYL